MKLSKRFSWMVFKGLFKKPATISYSGQGAYATEERIRGMLTFDRDSCVNCTLCMKDCPTGAIEIVNNGTKEERDMHAYLDLGLCIFCGQCGDSCSKNSIRLTPQSDLARFQARELRVELQKGADKNE